jgi:AbrB family looped-hinge helix DNA binding protein
VRRRVGTHGEVVIPKRLRDELGLLPGVEVMFERDAAGIRIVPAGTASTSSLRGRYQGCGLPGAL